MIYFLRIKDMPYVKIGYTKFKDFKRGSAYKTHSPFEHELLLFIEGDLSKEKELHLLFKASHSKGEWYNLSEEILNYILIEKHNSHLPKQKEKQPRIKPNIIKIRKDRRVYPKELKEKAFEMYNSGVNINEIAKLLNTNNKKAIKVCYDMGAKRPVKKLKYPKGYHHKANKIAYNNKKYKEGKITFEQLQEIKNSFL